MEILGIGPGEFVLILLVLLVVVGPERLPGLARQAGSLLVRARNWLQTSPDAALVLRARQEIEAELASIKTSLMEVQVVRDEVLGAAKQLEDSVGSITSAKLDLNPLNPSIKPPAEQRISASGQVASGGQALISAAPEGTDGISTPLDQHSTIDLPGAPNAPIDAPAESQPTNGLANGVAHSGSGPAPAAAAPPALAELESINIRLQAIMADMWALQQQLKQRGALDESWQPPSVDVQLSVQETAPLAGPEPAAEPIEDEAVLAARKRLEQLTPMNVSYHAPPAIEAIPADSTPEAGAASAAEPSEETAATPARKARKRRASAAADMGAPDAIGAPANDPAAPAEAPAKSRRRRGASAGAASADEPEPATTEKAS